MMDGLLFTRYRTDRHRQIERDFAAEFDSINPRLEGILVFAARCCFVGIGSVLA